MRRRQFMALVFSVAVFAPLRGFAQETGRTYRLGVLTAAPRRSPGHDNLFDELRHHGFVQGQNLIVDGRGYEARTEQFPVLATELANAEVEAILCAGPAATRAARDATHHIPIVAIVDDMVAAGFVPSLARPGRNITGVSILAPELDGKRLDILIELAPNARRIALLADPNSTASSRLQALRDSAQARGVELLIHMVDVPERIVPAIDEAKRMGATALNVLASPMLHVWRGDIIERAAAVRLPAIYQWVESAEEGGLVGYGPRQPQLYRQMARQLAKVFRGTKPRDLPVEQPSAFELVINLKTAKEIGHVVQRGFRGRRLTLRESAAIRRANGDRGCRSRHAFRSIPPSR